MQARAISAGVTGSDGLCSRVGKEPVTAQLMMVGFMSFMRERPAITLKRFSRKTFLNFAYVAGSTDMLAQLCGTLRGGSSRNG